MRFKAIALSIISLITLSHADESEPTYRIIESHTMESPVTNKEFENWETYKSSVYTENTIVLVPEVVGAKGAILNKQMVKYQDDWIVDVKVTIGNEMRTAKGGVAMAFSYLESINKEDVGTGVFGYSTQFRGI